MKMSHLSQHARKDNMEDKPWCMTRKYFPLFKSFIDSSQVPFLDGKTQKEYSGRLPNKKKSVDAVYTDYNGSYPAGLRKIEIWKSQNFLPYPMSSLTSKKYNLDTSKRAGRQSHFNKMHFFVRHAGEMVGDTWPLVCFQGASRVINLPCQTCTEASVTSK